MDFEYDGYDLADLMDEIDERELEEPMDLVAETNRLLAGIAGGWR